MMQRLDPKVFHADLADLADGLDLFVGCRGVRIGRRDETLVVVERDGAKACLVEGVEFAAKDRPELTIETDTIDALYVEVAGRRPDLLHPNLRSITTRPWGAREFAVPDRTRVCVVFREW